MKKIIVLKNGKKLELIKKNGYVIANIGKNYMALPFNMEQAEEFMYKSGLTK